MVKYDLPAMLKFVTAKTSKSSLYYVGHSQGTAIGFAGFSRNEEMAKMVKTFFALAPVTTVAYAKGPLKLLAQNSIEISVHVLNALHKWTSFQRLSKNDTTPVQLIEFESLP